MNPTTTESKDFLHEIVAADVAAAKYDTIITRFPPEPNGYLHIGHAKSICINFGLAENFGGRCHLRMDDTNPETEEMEYVEKIKEMVRWLGFEWHEHEYFASDYFDQFYEVAVRLVKDGKAYVDSQTEEEIRKNRGSVTEAGVESPFRNRIVAENLDLLLRMKNGEFPEGAHVLRAKGDMSSTNMKMRDPLLYRIRHASHYRMGDKWCIYPMYDFAHPISDAIENISHSLCTPEFDNNRAIYDWLMENAWQSPRPYQYEFARLNLDYTIVSKRKLLQLVKGHYVNGWDDPRMPTLAAARRRGITPAAIRDFCDKIGVTKADNRIDMALFDFAIRHDLNTIAPRVMAVLRPLKVVITNYPEKDSVNKTEMLQAAYFPQDIAVNESDAQKTRAIPFSREIYIEQDDFMETPVKGFHRLTLGGEVRLRAAYIIKCEQVIKDEAGNIVELHCTYDPATKSGADTSGKKVKGVIHWADAKTAHPAEFRLYDRLFSVPDPESDVEDFKTNLNPHSLEVVHGFVEPSVANDPTDIRYQFERQGYFWQDPIDSKPDQLVFNRIITLRDSWEDGRNANQATQVVTTTKKAEVSNQPQPTASQEAVAFAEKHNIPSRQAEIILANTTLLGFYEDALSHYAHARSVANWVSNEVNKAIKEKPLSALEISAATLAQLAKLVDDEVISATIGKQVIEEMIQHGGEPEAIIEAKGLRQITDASTIAAAVAEVIAKNPNQRAQYLAGKTNLLGFFVGQTMKALGGKANPKLLQEMVTEALNG